MDTAVITGVSRGLGAAMVPLLAEKFDAVVGISRSTPDTAVYARLDSLILEDMSNSSADWHSKFRAINSVTSTNRLTLINNAAQLKIAAVENPKFGKALRDSMEVNLFGPIRLIDCLSAIVAEKAMSFTIVHLGTGAAKNPIPRWGSYCISKSAISMFLKTLKLENPEFEILDIDPGTIDTNMQKMIFDDRLSIMPEKDRKSIAAPNLKSPEAAAKYVVSKMLAE